MRTIELQDIYARLDIELALRDLHPQDRGDYYMLTCPMCGRREAYIYKGSTHFRCNRANKCGFSFSVWQHVQQTYSLSKSETFKMLAACAGFDLRQSAWNARIAVQPVPPEPLPQPEPQAQPTLDTHLSSYQAALTEDSQGALYLHWRKIPFSLARAYGLGFSPPYQWCHFKNDRQVRQWRYGHIVCPLENPAGELVNLHARALDTRGLARRLQLSHDTLPGARGLFNARVLAQAECVFLCEAVFDALSLALAGITSVVALAGGNGLYWPWFREVKTLVFCFDADRAGGQAYLKLAKIAWLSGIAVYRLPPEIYGGEKDLNDALRTGTLRTSALWSFCRQHHLLPAAPAATSATILDGFEMPADFRD